MSLGRGLPSLNVAGSAAVEGDEPLDFVDADVRGRSMIEKISKRCSSGRSDNAIAEMLSLET